MILYTSWRGDIWIILRALQQKIPYHSEALQGVTGTASSEALVLENSGTSLLIGFSDSWFNLGSNVHIDDF